MPTLEELEQEEIELRKKAIIQLQAEKMKAMMQQAAQKRQVMVQGVKDQIDRNKMALTLKKQGQEMAGVR